MSLKYGSQCSHLPLTNLCTTVIAVARNPHLRSTLTFTCTDSGNKLTQTFIINGFGNIQPATLQGLVMSKDKICVVEYLKANLVTNYFEDASLISHWLQL